MADCGSNIQENDKVPGRVDDILYQPCIKEIMCQPCLSKDTKTVAGTFCSTCNEFQCIDCSGVHNVLDIFISHKLLNANVAHAIRCDQHQKVLDYFCEDEKKLCCSTCAIVDHSKCHSVVEVEKVAGKMTSPSSSLKEILQEAKENAEDIERHIITSKDQLAQNVQEIQAKIRETREEFMRIFDKLEASIVERAKSLQKETLCYLEKKQSQNEKHLANVKAYLETIHSIYQNGIPTQTFIAEQKIKNEVHVLCRNFNEECQNLQMVTIFLDLDEQLNLPPQSFTDYIPGQLTLKYNERKNVNAENKVMTLTVDSSIDLKKEWDDFKQPFYSGIDFLPDGRLVAVDYNNKKLIVYNEKFVKLGSCQLSYYPLSVVAVSEDEVAITSGSEYIIDFIRISKANKIRRNRKCIVTTKYDSICLKDNSQFVVGTIDYQIPVEIISSAGEPYVSNINFPIKAYCADTSACTYIKSSDKVVLTDIYKHTTYIYDTKTNTRVVVRDGQINEPCGVAISPSDTILVCSNGTDCIVELSQTGQVLSSYQLDMEYPYRVCVSHDKSFIVVANACRGNMKIQKFKISL
ncbi:uncharacterized protein LOC132726601 [Ruditapes philippinarum]|uniref:uncharacterized protein LOC132726601 n=1 Tax=Ruditapes philippinarum TaxID=129788 RepID=UPI00295AB74D|nr:uncharacterized protein LOC132726601 [Ruditapes philippinarum]